MLGFGRFKWRTVTGGSRTYVDAIAARLGDGMRLGAGVRVDPAHRRRRRAARRRRRRAVRPRRHRDARRRGARAARGRDRGRAARARAFRLHGERGDPAHRLRRSCRRPAPPAPRGTTVSGTTARPTITYYLNRLQALDAQKDYCVTLNETGSRGARARADHAIRTRSSRSTRCGRRPSCPALAERAHARTRARTSATASTRTGSRAGVAAARRASGWTGEVGRSTSGS